MIRTLATLILGLAACAGDGATPTTPRVTAPASPTASPGPTNLGYEFSVSGQALASLEALVEESDLIALGHYGPEGVEHSRSSDNRFIHIAQPFLVDEVVVGEAAVGDELGVLRTVTYDGSAAVELGTDPALLGHHYLLFLRHGDGIEIIAGTSQGQMLIEDGRIRDLSLRLDAPLDAVLSDIRHLAAN